MADRRMFAMTIMDSDAFLDLPLSSQALYVHLCMRADDDGFLNNAKKIQRMVGANDADLQELLEKRFLISFPSGVVVIKHWRMHNYIKKDRYKETVYTEEKSQRDVKENGSYTEGEHFGYSSDTLWNQFGYSLEPQVRVRDRVRDRVSKENIGSELEQSPSIEADDCSDFSPDRVSKKEVSPLSPLSPPLNNLPLISPCNPPSEKTFTDACTKEPSNASETPKNEQKPYVTDQVAADIIAKFTENGEYANELMVFMKHRRQTKKPMTLLALEQTLKVLSKKLDTDQERIDCLEMSIANGWQGVFPERAKVQSNGRQKAIGRVSTESGSTVSIDDYNTI